MKIKSFDKKLNLDKQTVATLNQVEMKEIEGRGTGYPCGTRTCVDTQCFC